MGHDKKTTTQNQYLQRSNNLLLFKGRVIVWCLPRYICRENYQERLKNIFSLISSSIVEHRVYLLFVKTGKDLSLYFRQEH